MAHTRITMSMVNRRYLMNLNRNFARKNKVENKIISERQYTRASQSPLQAAKALKVRKAMSETETYISNLETAKGIYNAAEDSVLQISGIMQTLQEKLIAAATDTYVQHPDKQIIAQEIENLAAQMVSLMNLVSADRRIFGGVNNSSSCYRIENGTVLFNGVDVNTLQNPNAFPDARTSYFDAGLGFAWLENQPVGPESQTAPFYGYNVDPQSAIASTFNGAAILGCGYKDTQYKFDAAALTGAASPNALTFLPASSGTYDYEFEVVHDGTTATVNYTGDLAAFQAQLDAEFGTGNIVAQRDSSGMITVRSADPTQQLDMTVSASSPDSPLTTIPQSLYAMTVRLASTQKTVEYTPAEHTITFAAGADEAATRANLNAALRAAFGEGRVWVDDSGDFQSYPYGVRPELTFPANSPLAAAVSERPGGFANNIIQLTLDAAKAVREDNGDLIALYADVLFEAGSALSLSIVNIGSTQAFIDFNINRLESSMLSLKEQQNSLEFTDMALEITNQKMLEMVYNATLQMSAATIPMSIFNFIK